MAEPTPVSAFTIVCNEELLIAKHLLALAQLSSDVVCIVQPSQDATWLIANHVADQLASAGVHARVLSHAPANAGKEFSLRAALDACRHDWCFNLDADESYLGVPLSAIATEAASAADGVMISRWHAIARDEATWFKVETWSPRLRLVDRRRIATTDGLSLHVGLEHAYAGRRLVALPVAQGRILEYKAASQHYVDQLFYESQDCEVNDAAACRTGMRPRDLRLGEALFEAGSASAGGPAPASIGSPAPAVGSA